MSIVLTTPVAMFLLAMGIVALVAGLTSLPDVTFLGKEAQNMKASWEKHKTTNNRLLMDAYASELGKHQSQMLSSGILSTALVFIGIFMAVTTLGGYPLFSVLPACVAVPPAVATFWWVASKTQRLNV